MAITKSLSLADTAVHLECF